MIIRSCVLGILGLFILDFCNISNIISSKAQAQTTTVRNVEVIGNVRIATNTILSVAGIESNPRALGAESINNAVQNLYQTGFFSSVDISRTRIGLRIVVEENPTINVISIEGNKRIKDDILMELISSKPRQTFSAARAEADAEAIAQAYAASGRIASFVLPKIIQRPSNRVDLIFQIVESRVSEVESISFIGNRSYSENQLRRAISTKQAGFFHRISRRDTYVPDKLELDKQNLRDFYLQNGFIDFRILSTTTDLLRTKDGFTIRFQIEEGQQFRFDEVNVTSFEPDINIDDYTDTIKISSGRVFDPRLIEKTIQRIAIRAERLNQPFLRSEPRITRKDDDNSLDVEFNLVKGPKTFIERINIIGNSITLDKVIRRQFYVSEGDAFNQRSIQDAADRIRALGYFSNVDINAYEGSTPNSFIVDVKVQEQPTGSLSFGLSYNTSDGVVGNVRVRQRNFLGRGQELNLSLSSSGESRNASIGFIEPQFLDRDLSAGVVIGGSANSSSFLGVRVDTLRFSPSISFPAGRYSRISLSYNLQSDNVKPASSTRALSPITQRDVDNSRLITSSVKLSYDIDRRNSPIAPTSGYTIRFEQELAGLGGNSRFSKSVFNFKTYRATISEKVIFSFELEGGYLKSFKNGSHVTNRFFLGGDELRGFENSGLGPRDQMANESLGGNYYAVARSEVSFPLGIPEEYGIYGGAFFDVGSVWGINDVPSGLDIAGEDRKPKIRMSIGLSLFWQTAIGPLRFNFSRPLRSESYDRIEKFRFTVDTRF